MRHKTTQAVLEYFNLARKREAAPLRADIDPQALKTVLPDVFILEMDHAGAFRFRLAGTRVCAILGQEARGNDFLSYFAAMQRHQMKLAAESVLANRTPLLIDINGHAEDEEPLAYEMLLLPLRSTEAVCDRLFGSLASLDAAPRIGDRGRTLDATRLSFLNDMTTASLVEPLASVAVRQSAPTPLMSRILHLRLLQGGRQD
jgi:hypothetical protein